MQIPALGHTQFAVLSALQDGRKKTQTEIRQELGWSRTRVHFVITAEGLHRYGFIEKAEVVLRCERTSRGRHLLRRATVLSITAAGRQAWRESLDWYLHVGQTFGSQNGGNGRELSATDETILSLRVLAPREKKKPVPDRIPTPSEAQKLLADASPEFAAAYRFLRLADLDVLELVTLQIEDVDPAAGVVRVGTARRAERQVLVGTGPRGPRELAIKPMALQLLIEAVGERTSGAVFLTPTGKPWNQENLSRSFKLLRDRAGLPRDVKLRGNTIRARNGKRQSRTAT